MIHLNLPEQVRTERLSIQRLKYEDAEEIFYTYASKPEATRYMSWPTHQSIKDTRSYLDFAVSAWRNGTDYSFTVRLMESSKLIGSFGAVNDNGKVMVGYIFSPTYWQNGYATEVCRKMIELLRGQSSVYRIQSFVDTENVASAKVLLRSGFVEEAWLPKWFRFVNQENVPKDCTQFRVPLP